MDYISIKNWEKYQHYRDRNPPWIKLYHSILDDYTYCCLQDDSKLLLMSLFLLASRCENKIPADIDWIKGKCNIKGKVNLEPLVTNGFLSYNGDASNLLAERKQNGVPETETETEKRRYIDHFDSFWNQYPRKIGKGKCIEKWKMLIKKKINPLDIIQGLEKYVNYWKQNNTEDQFIPHPLTWLNQGRWEDEVAQEDPYSSKTWWEKRQQELMAQDPNYKPESYEDMMRRKANEPR